MSHLVAESQSFEVTTIRLVENLARFSSNTTSNWTKKGQSNSESKCFSFQNILPACHHHGKCQKVPTTMRGNESCSCNVFSARHGLPQAGDVLTDADDTADVAICISSSGSIQQNLAKQRGTLGSMPRASTRQMLGICTRKCSDMFGRLPFVDQNMWSLTSLVDVGRGFRIHLALAVYPTMSNYMKQSPLSGQRALNSWITPVTALSDLDRLAWPYKIHPCLTCPLPRGAGRR